MFPGMLLTYFLNDFEIVPVAPIITGIIIINHIYGARGGAVDGGTALQAGRPRVRFPMVT